MTRQHRLQVKRIYERAVSTDGSRVLVDRLWPRGIRKEDAHVDLWLKDIAPSAELRKWFAHRPERWDEFKRRYYHELSAQPDAVRRLQAMAESVPVTLVYAARDEEHNQARALAEFLD